MSDWQNSATPAPVGADALRREELIAMAREADPFGDDGRLVSLVMLTPGTLERFAALVAAREREACAQVCRSEMARALYNIESAALLALGLLWMTERDNAKVQTAFKTLRDALGSKDALRKGIEAAIEAGYEADHPPGADWWAGKKEHPHE